MNEIISLMFPLILTIVIEYIVVQIMAKDRFVLGQVVIVNIITNPAINAFYRFFLIKHIADNTTIFIIVTILEILIWLLEGVMYKFMLKTKWSTAFKYSILSNAISYSFSFIL